MNTLGNTVPETREDRVKEGVLKDDVELSQ
jgi:hypothetical protein